MVPPGMGKKRAGSVEEKIERELEKLGPDSQEHVRQLLEYLKSLVEQYDGLPTHNEQPDFYTALDALMNVLKEEGVKINMKDIAEYLGVSYQNLRKQRSLFRKDAEEAGEPPPVQAGSLPDAVPTGKPAPQPPQPQSDEGVLKRATERQVDKQVMAVVKKKVEDVIKEEAELVFRLGKEFYLRWKPRCYAAGFEDLSECMHRAVEFYFESKDKVALLETQLAECQNAVRYLLLLQRPEIRRQLLLEKAKELIKQAATLPPREQKQVVEKILDMIEHVALAG